MATLLVRDVDEVLVKKLHQRAKANARSAAEEHRQILSDALLGGKTEDIHQLAARLRARIKQRGLPQGPPAEDLIREDRDNDDPYR
jgi:plasmid stability protein